MGIDKNIMAVSSVGVVAVIGLVVLMLGGTETTGNFVGGQRDALLEMYTDYYGDSGLAQQIVDCVVPQSVNADTRNRIAAGNSRRDCEVKILGTTTRKPLGEETGRTVGQHVTAERKRDVATEAGEFLRRTASGQAKTSDLGSRQNVEVYGSTYRAGLAADLARRYGGTPESWAKYAECMNTDGNPSYCKVHLSESQMRKLSGIPETSSGSTGSGGYNFPSGSPVITGKLSGYIFQSCMEKKENIRDFAEGARREVFCRCRIGTSNDDCRGLAVNSAIGEVNNFLGCLESLQSNEQSNMKGAWNDCSNRHLYA